MRRILLDLCRQLSASDQTAATAAAIVLVQKRRLEQQRFKTKQRPRRGSPARNPRTATTATEFVIVLPLLLVLCLISVDFGRFAHAYIALGNAGRTGAEYGATHSYSAATANAWKLQVEGAVRQDFPAIGDIDPAQLAVEIDVAQDAYGLNRARLTTSYPFETVVTWPMIPRPLAMQRTVVFRRFR
jgi:hypothetical protein